MKLEAESLGVKNLENQDHGWSIRRDRASSSGLKP